MSQPTPNRKRPYHYPIAGRVLAIAGILVMFLGVVAVFAAARKDIDSGLVMFFGVVALAGGYFGWFRGASLAAPNAEELLVNDTRAPILFIRSFADEGRDKTTIGFLHTTWGAFSQGKLQANGSNQVSPWGPIFQWQLNRLLSEIGPYVAIGRPGEKIAGMGAARMYVGDAEWQAVISQLFQRARLIIIRPGRTPGLRWEINQLTQHVKPTSILLIVPIQPEDYTAFCTWANQALPKPLPAEKPDGHFLMLAEDWTPQELPEKGTLLCTLEPFLNRNGVTRQQMSLKYRLVYDMYIVPALLAVGILIAAYYLASIL